MLYPDLRRLSLVCPTGMPLPRGTHNHEAGGSNDPPPPPQAGPAQEEALGKRDVVEAILRNLGGGNYRDACRVAARWCSLNSEHQAACQTHQPWTDLTQAVFPGSRKPNPRDHEPEHPRDWFFYLCNRHARIYQLIIFASQKRAAMERYHKMRGMTREELLAPYRERIEEVHRQRKEANKPGTFVTTDEIGGYKRALQHYKTRLRKMDERIRNLHKSPFAKSDEDDPARLLGEFAQLEAWLRGLYEDSTIDPFGPFRRLGLQPWWEPSWGVWGKPYWGPNGPPQ